MSWDNFTVCECYATFQILKSLLTGAFFIQMKDNKSLTLNNMHEIKAGDEYLLRFTVASAILIINCDTKPREICQWQSLTGLQDLNKVVMHVSEIQSSHPFEGNCKSNKYVQYTVIYISLW